MSLQIKDFLTEDVIQLQRKDNLNWSEAIKLAAQPLLDKGL